jgi:hypothetical protein
MATEQKIVYGLAAEFASAADLFHAAEKIRDAGFKNWDVHSPFPIHGMDKAMGLGKSWLSAIVLCGGVTGLLTAFFLETIPSTVLYKTIVHGKPTNFFPFPFSAPAFMPIMFELTVLFSAFACVFGLLVLNQLPRWNHPIFNWDRFAKATDDGFFLVIEARDPKFSETRTRQLLEEIGGQHVTLVHD